eukprot:scaffold3945_cov105-Isochrysis_galbana.AAC.9
MNAVPGVMQLESNAVETAAESSVSAASGCCSASGAASRRSAPSPSPSTSSAGAATGLSPPLAVGAVWVCAAPAAWAASTFWRLASASRAAA